MYFDATGTYSEGSLSLLLDSAFLTLCTFAGV